MCVDNNNKFSHITKRTVRLLCVVSLPEVVVIALGAFNYAKLSFGCSSERVAIRQIKAVFSCN